MVFRELGKVLANSFEKSMEMDHQQRGIYERAPQRPANRAGKSIQGMTSVRDFQEGAETIQSVIDVIKPEHVIFISKFTWNTIGLKLKKLIG